MTGNHIMLRDLNGVSIKQRTKDSFISATDLLRAGNRARAADGLPTKDLRDYFTMQQTDEFIEAVKAAERITLVKAATRGRNGDTWVHPMVALDFALWISPRLKVAVYGWVLDNLMRLRVGSAESFKEMNKAIDDRFNVGSKYWFYTNTADAIRQAVGVTDWAVATEEQLAHRDRLQNNVVLLCKTTKEMTFSNLVTAAINN